MMRFIFTVLIKMMVLMSIGNLWAAPLFENIGNLNYPIETHSKLAQRYFNQGLTLLYSFEYGESIRSFKAALAEDPSCAMCAWGLGLALSSKNGTVMSGRERDEAADAMRLSLKLVNPNNTKEVAYIRALQQRRSSKVYKKRHHFAIYCGGKGSVTLNETFNYADAMRKVVKNFPEDVNAKVLLAAALFDVLDWNLWSIEGKPQVTTLELIQILEEAIALDKDHIGANHYYIHALEHSPNPEKALESAKRLNDLNTGIEQLAHAPAHLYYALGNYTEAGMANQQALEAEKQYRLDCQQQGVKPETNFLYYHNLHSRVAALSMEGNATLAIQNAETLSSNIPQKNANLQGFMPVYILTLARFGDWQSILSVQNTEPQYQYALGMWYYAQGLANIHTGNAALAAQYLRGIKEIVSEGGVPRNFGQEGLYQLQIAYEVLAGVLANHYEHVEDMITHFKAAVDLQDKMVPKGPPSWYFPTRELLAKALLKTKKTEEAKAVFEALLKQNKNDPWALYGLMLCYTELGDTTKAKDYQKQFADVWKNHETMPTYLIDG